LKHIISINKGIKITIDWYLDNLKYFSSIKKNDFKKRIGLIK